MKSTITVSLRLNEEENEIIRNFAALKGMTVSEFLRDSGLRRVFNEISVLDYEEAKKEYMKKEKQLSSEELRRALGLDV